MIQTTAILVLASLLANGQLKPDEIVKVNNAAASAQAGQGSSFKIFIEVKIGYHIQANQVTDEYIIPTTLQIEPVKGFTLGQTVFPSSRKFKLVGTDNQLDVYDGEFEINVPFQTTSTIKKGRFLMKGKINYQACDSVRCLFPRTISFSIPIDIK